MPAAGCADAVGPRCERAVTTFDIARVLYALVQVGTILTMVRFAPPALRVLAGLSDSLALASRALAATAPNAEIQARMAAEIHQIHAAVCKPEARRSSPSISS